MSYRPKVTHVKNMMDGREKWMPWSPLVGAVTTIKFEDGSTWNSIDGKWRLPSADRLAVEAAALDAELGGLTDMESRN